ncbi:hypothetical protein AB3N04_19865 [Alkalihalophilus sp. As8PL]|uniref:Uncharacterized protein n=1 Tax=Alkalihalophilus sp. As8PL TaxID=3237103 RepID=A0AB39BYK0_9BACI
MARGQNFNHKKKSHPGAFPEGSEMKESKNNDHKTPEEDGFLATKEAFKNRVIED